MHSVYDTTVSIFKYQSASQNIGNIYIRVLEENGAEVFD